MSISICCECAASGFSTEIVHPARCQGCGVANPVTMESVRGESKENRQLRALRCLGILNDATSEAATVAPTTVAPVLRAARVRCPHYLQIRAFFAVCRQHGLNTKDNGAMRCALSKYFGFMVWSRSALTAEHWELAAAGVQAGELAW